MGVGDVGEMPCGGQAGECSVSACGGDVRRSGWEHVGRILDGRLPVEVRKGIQHGGHGVGVGDGACIGSGP